MPAPFRSVILFAKRHREKQTIETLRALIKLLKKQQVAVTIEKETAQLIPDLDYKVASEEDFCSHGELIIVIGGDGSLLTAARSAAKQKLPILGINRGRLGFLTDICPSDLSQVTKILEGHYVEEKRFLLRADIVSNKKVLHQQTGLNEMVLFPGDVAHMIDFLIKVDGEVVCTQRADGLIIATPTGSTAYALSGGGPILHPHLDAVVLVPMFPHTLTSRPIVLAGSSKIEILIEKSNAVSPRLSCDGQTRLPVKPGDSIIIRKKSKQLRLIHPLHYQYFATLRSKLQWEAKPY